MNSRKIVIGSLFCLIISLLECAPRKHTLLSRAPAGRRTESTGIESRSGAGWRPTTRPGYSSMGGRVSPEELNLLDVFVPRV
jgi:hypothetical protein